MKTFVMASKWVRPRLIAALCVAIRTREWLQLRECEDLHAGRSKEAGIRALRRARAARRHRGDLLAEEPRPSSLARRVADRGPIGKYIISDKPMTEEQWIRERAKTIDVTPEPAPKEDEESDCCPRRCPRATRTSKSRCAAGASSIAARN